MFQNQFVDNLVSKYKIDLDTPTTVLKQFVLEFNPVLQAKGYPTIRENIRIVRGCQDEERAGIKGTSIYGEDYSFILLYTEYFEKVTQYSLDDDSLSPEEKEKYVQDIRKSYVSAILHEMAHQVRDSMSSIGEDGNCTPLADSGHDSLWIDIVRFLGIEEKQLAPYLP